ncbi:hypothetical protein PCE1_003400 [Barthelona sp. PCE]
MSTVEKIVLPTKDEMVAEENSGLGNMTPEEESKVEETETPVVEAEPEQIVEEEETEEIEEPEKVEEEVVVEEPVSPEPKPVVTEEEPVIAEEEPVTEPTPEPVVEPVVESTPEPVEEEVKEVKVPEVTEADESTDIPAVLAEQPEVIEEQLKKKERAALPQPKSKEIFSFLYNYFPTVYELALWKRPIYSVLVLILVTLSYTVINFFSMTWLTFIATIAFIVTIILSVRSYFVSDVIKFNNTSKSDIQQIEVITEEKADAIAQYIKFVVNSFCTKIITSGYFWSKYSIKWACVVVGCWFLGNIFTNATLLFILFVYILIVPRLYMKFYHQAKPIVNIVSNYFDLGFSKLESFTVKAKKAVVDSLTKLLPFLKPKKA